MLFISPHPFLLIAGAVKEEVEYHPATAQVLDRHDKIDIRFQPVAPSWAVEQAFQNPHFQHVWRTLPEGANRAAYVGCYDTDEEARAGGWDVCHIKKCPERGQHTLKQHVEEALLQGVGQFGRFYIVAETEKPDAPYPNYVKDTTVIGRRTIEHVLDKVRQKIEEDGYSAAQVRAFEEATGRAESAEIIAFLDTLSSGTFVTA